MQRLKPRRYLLSLLLKQLFEFGLVFAQPALANIHARLGELWQQRNQFFASRRLIKANQVAQLCFVEMACVDVR